MARSAVSASPALRILPSGRSIAVGFALLAAGLGLYAAARQTSVFAVREIEVASATPSQARAIARALDELEGTSLLRVDEDAIQTRLERLPHVHLLGYDRAFPNGLRIDVRVERPAAVLRRGSDRWLVSAEGRVLRPLVARLRRPLPVVWVDRTVEPQVGVLLRAAEPATAVRTLAEVRSAAPALGSQVWYVKIGKGGTTTAVLRDRVEVRLGTPQDLAVKLTVARRILATLRREGATAAYLDVSVAERPVVGSTLESQVEP